MPHKYRLFHIRAAVVAGSTLLLLGPNARSAADVQLEEVVVTATRRSESLQSVPMSIQALSEEAMIERRITDLSALAASVPGLSLADGGPGYRTLFVRGVVSQGGAGTTGVYLDEVFVPPGGVTQTVIEPLYFDMERVEVLRGPQGTLFGGSSMGGTVRFLTRKADPTAFAAAVGSELSQTQHGGLNYEVNGMVNLPLVSDKAAVRVVSAYRERDGFVDKLIGNFSDPQRLGSGPVSRIADVNDEEFTGVRVQAVVLATDRLTIRPTLLYQKTHAGSVGAIDRPPNRLDQRRGVRVDEPIEDEFKLGNLTLDYQWDAMQLLSSSSYSRRESSFDEDASDILEESVIPGTFGGPRGLFFPTAFQGTSAEKSLQQELRLSSAQAGRLDWLIGLYYERYERDNTLDLVVPGFSNVLFPVPGDNFYHGATLYERTQRAVFAEVDWHLTRHLTATLGMRWYEYVADVQSVDRNGLLNGGALPDSPVDSSKENGVSPRFSLAYDFGEKMIYATASRGFRAGGPNADIPSVAAGSSCVAEYRAAGFTVSNTGEVPGFESDELWNYEVGAKTSWAQGRFVLNTALYRMNWDDLQQSFLPACGFGATLNFGKATITGVDLDYRLALTRALELSGGVNYNDAKIAEDVPQLGVAKGTRIQNAPQWGGNFNVRYSFPWLGGEAYASSTVRYVGSSVPKFNTNDPRTFQESYTVLGARLGLMRDSWQVSLFADNLTNQTPGVFSFSSTFLGTASHTRMFTLRGRTVGVDFRKNF